jgi:hypothetical protein
MKKIIVALISFVFFAIPAYAATTAIPWDALINGFHDDAGLPMADGTITFYANDGSSTTMTIWEDAAKTTAAANPVTLDAYGAKIRYFDDIYRVVLKDADGYTIKDINDVRIKGYVSLGFYIDVANDYGTNANDINDAISAAVSLGGGTLLFDGSFTVAEDILGSPNVIWKMLPGAAITIANGFTITPNAYIEAGTYQWKFGTGTLSLSDTYNPIQFGIWSGGTGITIDGISPTLSAVVTSLNSFYNGTATINLDTISCNEITVDTIYAHTLSGKLTAGSSEIEGSNFDINSGEADDLKIGSNTPSSAVFTYVTVNTRIVSNGQISANAGVSANNLTTQKIYAQDFIYSWASKGLLANTADGADTSTIFVGGGGGSGGTRGGAVWHVGNEASSYKGCIRIVPGLGDSATNNGYVQITNPMGQQIAMFGSQSISTNRTVSFHNVIYVGTNTNNQSFIGRARIGYDAVVGSNIATFGHYDSTGLGIALSQTATGLTVVNSALGQGIYFKNNLTDLLTLVSSSGHASLTAKTGYAILMEGCKFQDSVASVGTEQKDVSQGLILHQGALDDNILTGQSSDIDNTGAGYQTTVSSNTFIAVRKMSPTLGGAQILGLGEGAGAFNIHGAATTTDNGNSFSSESAPLIFSVSKGSGAIGANDNLAIFKSMPFGALNSDEIYFKGDGSILTQGTVSANAFKYNSAQTRYYAMPACQFQVWSDPTSELTKTSSGNYSFTGDTWCSVFAPVNLPDSCSISNVSVFTSSGSDYDWNFQLVRATSTGTDKSAIAAASASSASGANTLSDSSISVTTILNNGYNYFIFVQFDGDGVGTDTAKFEGATITYTVTNALP